MSLVQELLYIVSNYPGGYRVIYDILYDNKTPEQTRATTHTENTLRSTLSRMKAKGLLSNSNSKWKITHTGKVVLYKHLTMEKLDHSKSINNKIPKQVIVIFDIPEKLRKHRDWLRVELVSMGFELIQKSVWFGPPLPKEFIEYLREQKLLSFVRFFKATENDLV